MMNRNRRVVFHFLRPRSWFSTLETTRLNVGNEINKLTETAKSKDLKSFNLGMNELLKLLQRTQGALTLEQKAQFNSVFTSWNATERSVGETLEMMNNLASLGFESSREQEKKIVFPLIDSFWKKEKKSSSHLFPTCLTTLSRLKYNGEIIRKKPSRQSDVFQFLAEMLKAKNYSVRELTEIVKGMSDLDFIWARLPEEVRNTLILQLQPVKDRLSVEESIHILSHLSSMQIVPLEKPKGGEIPELEQHVKKLLLEIGMKALKRVSDRRQEDGQVRNTSHRMKSKGTTFDLSFSF
jgi:hypothetical protein